MKLSIIIPIFGVEKYIEKCLLSCINQGSIKLGSDYEIICINDGTKDKSGEIARRIADRYCGITIIDQENQGLSAARNNGTALSKGEYIWYVDSDDYIEEKCLEHIIPLLKDDLDILQLKWRLVYEDGRQPQYPQSLSLNKRINGIELLKYGRLVSPVQFTILRSAFLKQHNLHFENGIYHEDAEFKPRVAYLANSIEFATYISYNYLQRSGGSIMSTFNPKRMYDSMIIVNNLLRFMDTYVKVKDQRLWAKAFSGPISELLYIANKSDSESVKKDAKRFIAEHPRCIFALTCSPSFSLRCVGYLSKLFGNRLYNVYSCYYYIRYRKWQKSL